MAPNAAPKPTAIMSVVTSVVRRSSGLKISPMLGRLSRPAARFAAQAYYHIGDTELDDHVASGAGFRFLKADVAAHRDWAPALLPELLIEGS